ncbi:MAG: outer membrane beta-barrel protein [Bacteroidota bacterium]
MKYLFTLFLLLFAFFCMAQKTANTFLLTYGSGKGDIAHYGKIDGNLTTEHQKSLNSFGINYHEGLNKHLFIETGLIYINYKYTTTFNYPNLPQTETNNTLKLLNLPIKIRLEFAKLFFLNAGLLMDINLDQSDLAIESGVGATAGLGVQYYYKNRFGLTINPQANLHGLITGEGLIETNVTFGLAYRINKN